MTGTSTTTPSTLYPKDEVVRLELSESQFARMIASVNIGTGIPCTLSSVMREKMDPPEPRDTETLFKQEAGVALNEAVDRIESLEEMAEEKLSGGGGYMSNSDREALLKEICQTKQQLKSNVPFVLDMLEEAVEKTVDKAKADIESFAGRQADRLQGIADAVGADVGIKGFLGQNDIES